MTTERRDPMTPADIRALAEAATPGPWREVSIGHHCAADAARVSARAVEAGVTSDLSWVDQMDDEAPHIALAGNGPNSWNNGRYIAALDPQTVLALLDRLDALEAALGEVYADRNLVVQAFAKAQEEADWPVAWGVDESEPDWPVLYIETGAGQVSWHIPVAERAYEPPERPGFVATWDGHTNEQKAERLRAALREPVR